MNLLALNHLPQSKGISVIKKALAGDCNKWRIYILVMLYHKQPCICSHYSHVSGITTLLSYHDIIPDGAVMSQLVPSAVATVFTGRTASFNMDHNVSPPVLLDENDVPGAILLHKTPEHCSMTHLKRWLKCRNLPITASYFIGAYLRSANLIRGKKK